jgi:CO/xanthine dehydrogenase FAD-binding subunit
MTSPNFTSPKSLKTLCKSLRLKDESTFIAAGCTDLLIHLNQQRLYDYKIIDITHLSELKKIQEQNHTVTIGACVTMTELENSPIVARYFPALKDAAYHLGSKQIRNLATLGGNIANASQSADTLPVLFAYEAELEILDSSGRIRLSKVMDTIEGLGKNTLKKDEVILKIHLQKSTALSAFSKIGARSSVTISKLNACIKLGLTESGTILSASIYLGAVGVKPIQAQLIENALTGSTLEGVSINSLDQCIKTQIEKAIPTRASRHYKKQAALGVIEDALGKITALYLGASSEKEGVL